MKTQAIYRMVYFAFDVDGTIGNFSILWRVLCGLKLRDHMANIDLALISDMKDFEDSFQYHTAINNSACVIITRNLKDFINVQIPIMSAEDYINSTQKE